MQVADVSMILNTKHFIAINVFLCYFKAIWAFIGALHCMKIATLLQNKHDCVQ